MKKSGKTHNDFACMSVPKTKTPTKLVERNLYAMKPEKASESFAPTDANPVRTNDRMGGME